MSGSLSNFGNATVGSGIVTGTDGRDILIASGGDATLEGGWGNDVLIGGNGNDTLNAGRISLIQQQDDNVLFGGGGNDTLRGAFGNDTMLGGDGNDLLISSGGQNTLFGGEGNDIFEFGHGAPATPFRQVGSNLVLDFTQGQDKIDLSMLNYLGGDTDLPYTFIGEAAFSGAGPEVRFRQSGDLTLVELDTRFLELGTVDGEVDGVIRLDGHYTLTIADFIL